MDGRSIDNSCILIVPQELRVPASISFYPWDAEGTSFLNSPELRAVFSPILNHFKEYSVFNLWENQVWQTVAVLSQAALCKLPNFCFILMDLSK